MAVRRACGSFRAFLRPPLKGTPNCGRISADLSCHPAVVHERHKLSVCNSKLQGIFRRCDACRDFGTESREGLDGRTKSSLTTVQTSADENIGFASTRKDASEDELSTRKDASEDRLSTRKDASEDEMFATAPPSMSVTVDPAFKPSSRHDLAMLFTCTVCQVRSAKTMSRATYETGVVIVRCPGCQNLHLIADRYGWFGKPGSVENFLAEKGLDVRKGSESSYEFTMEDMSGWTPKVEDSDQ